MKRKLATLLFIIIALLIVILTSCSEPQQSQYPPNINYIYHNSTNPGDYYFSDYTINGLTLTLYNVYAWNGTNFIYAKKEMSFNIGEIKRLTSTKLADNNDIGK
jgi:hypothetical protein